MTDTRGNLVKIATGTTIILGVGGILGLLHHKSKSMAKLRKQVGALEKEVTKVSKQRDQEHSGRMGLQKELQRFVASKLQADGALYYSPIGTISSCFKHCVGTPRQGLLAPATRAVINFRREISSASLEGLDNFSHVWVFFCFHLNNNPRWTRTHIGMAGTFPSKVTPPFLKRKVGLFATRSPHRPNNIGVSLCQLEKVVNKGGRMVVHLRGVDLLEGTPVLDVKPFVSAYDSAPDARVAPWVDTSLQHLRSVTWSDKAVAELIDLGDDLKLYYREPEAAQLAITQALEVDLRSAHKTQKVAGSGIPPPTNEDEEKDDEPPGILLDANINSRGGMTILFDNLAVRYSSPGDFNVVYVECIELAKVEDVLKAKSDSPPLFGGSQDGNGADGAESFSENGHAETPVFQVPAYIEGVGPYRI